MTIWDRLKGILKSEAKDVGEGLSDAHDKLDRVLTQKERELNATPTERMEMTLDEIADSDDRFDAILNKAEGRGAMANADSEVAETVARVKKPDLADRLDQSSADQPGVEQPAAAPEEPAVEQPPAAPAADTGTGAPVASEEPPVQPTDDPDVAASPGGLEYVADTEASSASDAGVAATARSADAALSAEEAAEAERKRLAEEARIEAERERRRLLDARRAEADAKFEQQKERAGDILDELRGELGIDD